MPTTTSQPPTWLSHLRVLRKRLLQYLLSLGILFVALCPFSNTLYRLLATPLLRHLPNGLIATNVTASFVVPLKLAFITAFCFSVPVLLYQLGSFVTPALYRQERRWLWPLLFLSTFLFYAGMSFAYFCVFPLMFHFFTQTIPVGVTMMPDISQYLDFVLQLFFIFGLTFEMPIVMLLLFLTGLTSLSSLIKKRPYVIVLAFVLGMLFAPPDVFSQVLVAIPLCLLFEISILLVRTVQFFQRQSREQESLL